MSKPIRFVIVGDEMPLISVGLASDNDKGADISPHLSEFLIHASLDMISDAEDNTPTNYLGIIDKVNNLCVSAFITPGNRKFMLLHKDPSDDSIRLFFNEVYDYYVRAIMNPFYKHNGLIHSVEFERKIREIADKYLR
ncbi:hypothetical protein WA158_004744 [Blastocystis sp. Blastoise]